MRGVMESFFDVYDCGLYLFRLLGYYLSDSIS